MSKTLLMGAGILVAGSAQVLAGTSGLGAQASVQGRACHAMTYASGHRAIVMFGGSRFCGTALLQDTALWAWDGTRWTPRPGPFAEPREDVLLAYDGRRGTVLLYGGRASGRVFNDTWEWNGSTWATRAASGAPSPGPLEHAAIAYDSARGRVVVFGGARRGAGMQAETWEWSGDRWERAASDGPPARIGHSMAWSGELGVVMYGGFNEAGSLRDLWRWDGRRWSLVDSLGPAHTEGPALVATPDGLVLVGKPVGVESTARFATWTRRAGAWVLSPSQGPPFTIGQALVYDAERRATVLFGGTPSPDAAPSSETWIFTREGWSRAGPP